MKFGIRIPRALCLIVARIAAAWTLINVGYYFILPRFGLSLSYNSAPAIIALYYLACVFVVMWHFRATFTVWVGKGSDIWWYGLWSLAGAAGLCGLVYVFSLIPILQGPLSPPYTDLLFATSWYFLPKAIEILIQQLLITVFVVETARCYPSLKKVVIGYIVCFVGAHAILFLLNGSPAPYAMIMTFAAFLTSFMFPYLILKIRGGFLYSYFIHFAFYIVLAVLLRVWPPPGYFA